jgi:uncharacterized membrane protein
MNHSIEKTSSLIRLETFVDAVVAVAITLMVLDLKPPEITLAIRQNTFDFSFLHHYWPKLLALTLSFIVIATRWTGLLAYFRPVTRANPALIWLTMVNLFAICLIPGGTAFLAENPTLPQAVSTYGFLGTLVLASAAALERKIELDCSGVQGWSFRNTLIVAGIWAISIPLAFVSIHLSFVIIVAVTLLYFVPLTLRQRIFDAVLKHRPIQSSDDDA